MSSNVCNVSVDPFQRFIVLFGAVDYEISLDCRDATKHCLTIYKYIDLTILNTDNSLDRVQVTLQGYLLTENTSINIW